MRGVRRDWIFGVKLLREWEKKNVAERWTKFWIVRGWGWGEGEAGVNEDRDDRSRHAMIIEVQELKRIAIDPEVMVANLALEECVSQLEWSLKAIAAGRTVPELLADFPYLEDEDVRESLAFEAFHWSDSALSGPQT
jgi:uncharacterized protein (DUF433 family)